MLTRDRHVRWIGVLIAVMLLVGMGQGTARADTRYWIGGAEDGLWSSAGNWDSAIPGAHDDAQLFLPATITLDSGYHSAAATGLGNLTIGSDSGDVVFSHSSNTLYIGDGSTGEGHKFSLTVNGTGGYSATYNLSGTGVLIKDSYEVKIGTNGLGYFNQSGGTFQLSGALYLGDDATGYGRYTMTGGEIVEGPNGLGGIALGEWGGTGEFLQSGGSVTIGELSLARQVGSTGNYELSDTGLLSTTSTTVGDAGTGTFTQTGGSHSTGTLILGRSGVADVVSNEDGNYISHTTYQGKGTYTLNAPLPGEGSNLSVTGDLVLGDGGTGTFEHQSGRVTIEGDLILGRQASHDVYDANKTYITTEYLNGTGTYNLSDGELWVGGSTYVGLDAGSLGTFNQSGGKHTVQNDLWVDAAPASKGVYNLSRGTLEVQGSTIVGSFGNAIFNQGPDTTPGLSGENDGGSHTITGGYAAPNYAYDLIGLDIGSMPGGSGTYNLTGGVLDVANFTVVGNQGTGAFNLGNPDDGGDGTHNTGGLFVGFNGGNGQYNLYSGTLNVSGVAVIGGKDYNPTAGTGEFNQYGGTNRTGGMWLGDSLDSTGTYNLYDGVLTVGSYNVVGARGTGTFNQSGGTHNANWTLEVGGAGNGTYNLLGGELTTNGTIVGNWGTGIFNQGYDPETGDWGDGGSHVVNGTLVLGNNGEAEGTYNLFAGGLIVGAEPGTGTRVGDGGTGIFNQFGGTHTTTGLVLGQWKGSSGTYDLSGDDSVLSVINSGDIYLGVDGTGTFKQSDNSRVEANNLFVGSHFGSGAYELNSGTLTLAGVTSVGADGTGTFKQYGGTHTVAGDLEAGVGSSGIGYYELNDGRLSVGAAERIGVSGTGLFKQTGGVHVIGADLVMANNAGSIGGYTLAGGDLYAGYTFDTDEATYNPANGSTFVGMNGKGTFTQTGGSHYISGGLTLGQESGSEGIYDFNTGTGGETNDGRLSVSGHEHIGVSGAGTFTQGAGTHTVGGDLVLGNDPGSNGTFRLNGGSLTVSGTTFVGMNGTGTFEMNGGTLKTDTINNNGTFEYTSGAVTYNTFINNGAFYGNLTQASGTLKGTGTVFGDVTINGGTVAPGNSAGTLRVTGSYTQLSGTTLEIELRGTGEGDYDVLKIDGAATLGGILKIIDIEGDSYTPQIGDFYDILFASTMNGTTFDSIVGPSGYRWDVAYLGDTVRLTANAVPIPGAVWLLASGLAAIVGIRRRSRG